MRSIHTMASPWDQQHSDIHIYRMVEISVTFCLRFRDMHVEKVQSINTHLRCRQFAERNKGYTWWMTSTKTTVSSKWCRRKTNQPIMSCENLRSNRIRGLSCFWKRNLWNAFLSLCRLVVIFKLPTLKEERWWS